jgi:hypothetical protein
MCFFAFAGLGVSAGAGAWTGLALLRGFAAAFLAGAGFSAETSASAVAAGAFGGFAFGAGFFGAFGVVWAGASVCGDTVACAAAGAAVVGALSALGVVWISSFVALSRAGLKRNKLYKQFIT